MKEFISILLCFLCLPILGQHHDTIPYKKYDIGFTFSPDYSFRVLKTNFSGDTWVKDTYDTIEVSKYSFTTGLNFIFHVNKHFFIGTGLLLSDKGEKTKEY